jgi:polar amino acid transport system permease protein
MMSYEYLWAYLTSPVFVHGALMTLVISVLSLAGGLIVGLAIALVQDSRWSVLKVFTVTYLWLFRGTPLLLQLVFVFNVLPSFGLVLSGFACAVLTLSLNEGAYMAEIMRSGIRAVGPGQRLAGRAHGMRDWQIMRWIVLPQALRIIVPPIGNQFIGMLKMSALVSVISVQELLMVASQTASANFRYFEALTAAGIYYLALTTLFMAGQAILESTMQRRGRSTGGWWSGWSRLFMTTPESGVR